MSRDDGVGEPTGQFLVEVTPDPRRFVVRVSGELDAHSAASFRAHAVALLDAHVPGELVLSVEDLSFVDSSGLRSFLELREETQRREIQFSLSNASSATRNLLAMVGLDETFQPSMSE